MYRCTANLFVYSTKTVCSLLILAAMTVNRWCAVCRPHCYKSKSNNSKKLSRELPLFIMGYKNDDFQVGLCFFPQPRLNYVTEHRGGSRIFSRGGADFQKIFQNFHDLFFRSIKLIFRALSKHCFAPILAKFSAPQVIFLKNSQESRFWALFEKF